MSGSGIAGRAGAVLDHARRRTRTGLGRVRAGFGQSLQITIAAVGAYAFAEHVLGHHGPLFSATAAIVSLGYGNGSVHLRRILEVSLGCTLGIAVGDVLMHVLGQGLVQASVVLLVSILLARFLDNGTIFTTQMGLQSVLVVILPPSVDGPFAVTVMSWVPILALSGTSRRSCIVVLSLVATIAALAGWPPPSKVTVQPCGAPFTAKLKRSGGSA